MQASLFPSPNKTEFIKAKYQMLAYVHRMPCREDDSVTAKDLSKVGGSSLSGLCCKLRPNRGSFGRKNGVFYFTFAFDHVCFMS